MLTANKQAVQIGCRLKQIAPIGLGSIGQDVVVQQVDHEHDDMVSVGESLDGPPKRDYDGNVRFISPAKFEMLSN